MRNVQRTSMLSIENRKMQQHHCNIPQRLGDYLQYFNFIVYWLQVSGTFGQHLAFVFPPEGH